MACNSLSVENGASTPDITLAATKKLISSIAARVIMLFDAGTVGRTSFACFAPLETIDTIVTDAIGAEDRARLEQSNIDLLCFPYHDMAREFRYIYMMREASNLHGKESRRLRFFAFISVLFVSGCAIPFDITTSTMTIELSNTLGQYVEGEIEIPAEALRNNITFSEIILYYTVRKNDSIASDVSIYASTDQTADNAKGASDEKLIDVSLGATDTEISGEVISVRIRDALNNKQPKFVVGCENMSVNPIATLLIDLELRVAGKYSAF